MSRNTHYRDRDHSGTEGLANVAITQAINEDLPAGTTVDVVLASFVSRFEALDNAEYGSFTANAVIKRGSGSLGFRLDAYLFKTGTQPTSGFLINAYLLRTQTGSFTLDAVLV